MPNSIYNYDGSLFTVLQDYSLDSTSSSLKFLGAGYRPYGEIILEDIVWTMEHFAAPTPPGLPIKGQAWYDTSLDIIKIYDGANWNVGNGAVITTVKPLAGFSQGAFWYNPESMQLSVWNGANWDIVGPLGSAANDDPISNELTPDHSVIDAVQFTDIIGTPHQAVRFTVGDMVVAIVSKDAEYSPKPPIAGFATLSPGINVSTLLVPNTPDPTIFRSTQDNVPTINNFYGLGSPTARFGYTFANTGVFDKLYINSGNTLVNNTSVQTSNYSFSVTGNVALDGKTTFGNTVVFGGSTSSSPSILFNSGNLLINEVEGAIEFDGTDLYATVSNNNVLTRLPFTLGPIITPGSWGATFTGTSTTINAVISPIPPTIIPINAIVYGIIPQTNTSNTVIFSVNGKLMGEIYLSDGSTPIPIGVLIAGHVVLFQWNGSNWLAITDLTANGFIGNEIQFLPLSGGTLTGPIVLPGDPIGSNESTTKHYVDESATAAETLILNVQNALSKINLANYLPLSGGTMTGFPLLPGNPGSPLQAIPKQYVDSSIAALNISNYLPTTGGTMTGVLSLSADPTQPLQATTLQYLESTVAAAVSSSATFASIVNTQIFYSSGTYTPYSGAVNLFIALGDTNGNIVFGTTTATSASVTIGSTSSFKSITTSGQNNIKWSSSRPAFQLAYIIEYT